MAYAQDGLFASIQAAKAASPGLSAKELALNHGCCRQTISAVVRKKTGISFRDWSATHRWEVAATLLRDRPSMSITSIGSHLGFSTVQAFDHAFRRRFGLSPSGFRTAPPPGAPNATESVPVRSGPQASPHQDGRRFRQQHSF
jgi:transcriptional regulator GlxA family with amidase domain